MHDKANANDWNEVEDNHSGYSGNIRLNPNYLDETMLIKELHLQLTVLLNVIIISMLITVWNIYLNKV